MRSPALATRPRSRRVAVQPEPVEKMADRATEALASVAAMISPATAASTSPVLHRSVVTPIAALRLDMGIGGNHHVGALRTIAFYRRLLIKTQDAKARRSFASHALNALIADSTVDLSFKTSDL
jgi:hypothetical protein